MIQLRKAICPYCNEECIWTKDGQQLHGCTHSQNNESFLQSPFAKFYDWKVVESGIVLFEEVK